MKDKDRLYLQQCFLRMVLEADHSCSEAELDSWGQNLSISLQNKSWICIVVKLMKSDFSGRYLLQLEHQCKKAISEQNLEGYIVTGSNLDVVMLLPYLEQDYRMILEKMQKRISRRMGFNIYFGIGSPCCKFNQLRDSKAEAYEALDWCGEQINIADIQDIDPQAKSSDVSLNVRFRCIIEKFKEGTVENLQKSLTVLAEQVRANTVIQPDAPYPTSIRRTMIELLVEMLHIASDAGVDVDAEIDYVDPYRKVFELQSTPTIIQWVADIATALSKAMLVRKERMEKSQLEKVKNYIDEHLPDMALSLSSASQFVGMSPSYFSAFFIREAGIGFKEYVTVRRIDLAQKYLVETNDSINIISERCGFLSPSYFISVFKSQTGLTPGVFRKMKN